MPFPVNVGILRDFYARSNEVSYIYTRLIEQTDRHSGALCEILENYRIRQEEMNKLQIGFEAPFFRTIN